MDLTFEESVKRQKAVEWLLVNDPIVRAAAERSRQSLVAAVLIGAEYGELLAAKTAEVAKRMEVTEQERQEGYPLPETESERIVRAKARANAAGLSR